MTVKALKKQLMAAIAMVVVSAIALSSSTYAWFASNNKVSATGMQVQAKAEGGIEIAYAVSTGTNGSYATSATAGMEASTQLLPTSTVATATSGAISSDWYHATAAVASASAAKSGTYTVLSLANNGNNNSGKLTDNTTAQDTTQYYDGEGNQYYLLKTFNIRSVSSSVQATDLKVSSIEITGASQNLSKSLRVAITCGSNSVIYAPCGYNAATTYSVATAVSDTGIATMGSNNVTALIPTTASGVIASTVAVKGESNNGGTDVNIYVYFEGEDSNLYSNNIANTLDALSLTVNFEATVG